MQLFSNNAGALLTAQALAGDTSLTVDAGDVFNALAANEYEILTLIRESDESIEIVKVTARAANVLTVVRAQEGTAALQFEVGDRVEARVTAAGLKFNVDSIISSSGGIKLAPTDPTGDSVLISPRNIAGSGNFSVIINGHGGGDGSTVIGAYAYAANNSIAIGKSSEAFIEKSNIIGGVPMIEADTYSMKIGAELESLSGNEAVITTSEIDLTEISQYVITLSAGMMFFPGEVGLLIMESVSPSSDCSVSIGDSATTDKYAAISPITGSTLKRYSLPLASSEPSTTSFSFDVTTAASATSLIGRFYVRGINTSRD